MSSLVDRYLTADTLPDDTPRVSPRFRHQLNVDDALLYANRVSLTPAERGRFSILLGQIQADARALGIPLPDALARYIAL